MILAGIVTFNPDLELLNKNLQSITKQVAEVVVVDNGSSNILEIKKMVSNYKLFLICNKKNLGIAAALNQIIVWAKNKGASWVITLDQDTVCPRNMVHLLEIYIDNKVGIIAPRSEDRKNTYTQNRTYVSDVENVEWVISSASMINIKAWEKVGGYDEKLFIDGVDIEYAMRLRQSGYKIEKINTVVTSHAVGDAEIHSFLGMHFVPFNHNKMRKYYIARNTIIIAYKSKNKKLIIKSYFQIMKQLSMILFFEKDKKEKIVSVFKGVIDSRKYFKE